MERLQVAGDSDVVAAPKADLLMDLLVAYVKLNTMVDPPGYRAELAQVAADNARNADPAARQRLERRAEILQFYYRRYQTKAAGAGRRYGYHY